MSTAGTLTRWFRDELAPDLAARQRAGQGNTYDLLEDAITDIPPGSDGLIVLPYFSGERTPINDPRAKGVFFGLKLRHTRAHLYQACLEGVAYGIEQHLRGYAEIGMQTKRIVAMGGGVKTRKWMQVTADVTGMELSLGGNYGAALGSAMLAMSAEGGVARKYAGCHAGSASRCDARSLAGSFAGGVAHDTARDIGNISGLKKMIKSSGSVLPNLNNRAIYKRRVAQYTELYENTKDLMR